MGILCPVAVEVAAKLCADLEPGQGSPLFYSTVGAVLAGAIFGDHCSPISDTTVLSSLATSCTLEQHVWTQMPYALLAAVVGVLGGHVLCNVYGQPWWLGLLVGVVALLVIVRIVGRRAPKVDAGSAESE
jgi:Na+/H+ antiporter NhaC